MATQSEEVKWDVISRAAKGLRELDEYTNVLINLDMTRMERGTKGKLRAEAQREAYTPPTLLSLQVQAKNQLATQTETVLEVAQAMQVAPNDQASTPAAVQAEQVVGDREVQEQVGLVGGEAASVQAED
ncbi:hypothetical protein Pcinc_029813 [Petrolisthes cinctipes]|uniref:Uncharacterized protein n=1 Tax=Petrolisthes cinctipes TaxID=88211 RepID=A0AAE1EZK8_PETCI|nr:hypothetical protein Pcinc_029813 [Petrolisthes cinctipes]